MWSAPDDALLAGFGVGDPDATSEFVRRFQARVYGLAHSVVNDAVLAEDVAQEAFLRAWRHARTYDPRKGTVATWLLSITRNAAIDSVRLRRPQPVDPEVVVHLDVGDSEARGPAARAEVGDDVRRLRSILADVPEEQRRVLLLATVYGRTTTEIAQIEDIPLGTAKTRLRSGLSKVRGALGTARRDELA